MATIIFLLSFIGLSWYMTSITSIYLLPLWLIINYGLSLVIVILFYLLQYPLVLILKPSHPYKHYLMRSISFLLIHFFLGLNVKVTGTEHIPKSGPLVVYANHKSYTDGFVAMRIFKRPLTLTPKKSVLKLPLLKGWLKAYDVFPINRSNPRETANDLIKAVETVKNGHAMIIYPEGQIKNRLSEEIEHMKPGAFKIAFKAEADIILIKYEGNDLVRHRFPFRKTFRKLTVLPLFKYDQYKHMTTHELAMMVMSELNQVKTV